MEAAEAWRKKKARLICEENKRANAFIRSRTKYVIQHRTGNVWKTIFPNGVPMYFNTPYEAKAYITKMKISHPQIMFRIKKQVV